MPTHDWSRAVEIFHAFHHNWITELARAVNRDALPGDHYALPEWLEARPGVHAAKRKAVVVLLAYFSLLACPVQPEFRFREIHGVIPANTVAVIMLRW